MSKFTQGTWKPCIDGSVDIEDDRGRLIGTICDIVRLYDDEAEAMANARLIASAPEMYGLIASIANLPDEQCMIGSLIHEARRLIARIDSEEAD